MGADYSAYAVIGVDVDVVLKKTMQVVKAFPHDYPSTMKFCPETGRQLWEKAKVSEKNLTFDEDDSGDATFVDIPGMKLYRGTDGSPEIFGYGVGESTYSNGGDGYEFRSLKMSSDKIKEALIMGFKKYGLTWNEKAFGLYSILYCSY